MRGTLATFSLGVKSLALHKLRSVLTTLGILIGVAAVVAMLAIGEGASEAAQEAIKKMGSMTDILGLIPGMGALRGKFNPKDLDERRMAQVEAIIHSMTSVERQEPSIINGSRRKRIADGSGTSPAQVNQLLSQFKQMQKMMKKLSGPGGKRALMGMMDRRSN